MAFTQKREIETFLTAGVVTPLRCDLGVCAEGCGVVGLLLQATSEKHPE